MLVLYIVDICQQVSTKMSTYVDTYRQVSIYTRNIVDICRHELTKMSIFVDKCILVCDRTRKLPVLLFDYVDNV